ncbi:MAG TPA: transglycosylase SLT domain-containing protein [Kouleothrix sp.]|nr:transglycosylase SLT domain-containing protein [Kouleothrix sp.]
MNKPPRSVGWLVLALLLAGCDIVSFSTPGAPTAPAGAPSATLAATATPALTALPAPELLNRALAARSVGEYDDAALDTRALLDAHPNSAEARPAAFYLAESFVLRERWTSAIEALRAFLASGPQPGPNQPPEDLYARAVFLLARSYEAAGDWASAVAQYERYRTFNTVLEPYARLREAAQQQALGQSEPAAQSYEAAARSDIVAGERAGAYEKAIALRKQLGQNDAALALYRTLLGFAESPEYRARILNEAAVLADTQGVANDARAWRRELAEKLPATSQALDAVAALIADPQGGLAPVAAAQVYARHEQWNSALPFYDTAIASASGDDARELRRLKALAQRGSGDFTGALEQLAAIAAETPNSEPGRQAQLDWVQTRGQQGDTQAAIDGYREFATAYPDDPRAPEALSRAATLLGRLNDSEGVIRQQLDLGARYPASEQAHDALYSAGWALFQRNRTAEARNAWETLRQHTQGIVASQAAFWSALTLGPQATEYPTLLAAARDAAPDSYYATRAADLLGTPITGTVTLDSPISAESWRATEDWLAAWSNQPAMHLAEQGYPTEVAQAPAVLRAIALNDVGLQPEAIAEWNAARSAWHADPSKLYLLARLAYDHNVPYIALKAAEDVARAAPDASFAHAPEALRRLIFPTPYSSVLLAQAREYKLDPLALYALLRQESLFNPGATSWVGARGLAQVMPATAQGIAQNLGIAEFHEQDLYRPALSIRFGAFYLGHQLNSMQGSLQGALAAYNGGPGNAQRWAGGTTVADPDGFTEAIDFAETRNYVKLVYGYYGAYQRLYSIPTEG